MTIKKLDELVISLVVPVFNEEDTIVIFINAVKEALVNQPWQLRVLFVDDGSKDGTLEILRQLSSTYDYVHYLSLSRNFGKEAALTAGILNAEGDAVIPLDVDLQDPPELIPEFVRIWHEQKVGMVYGVRESRNDDTTTKRQTAGWFYKFFNKISDIGIPENAGDFRLLDRQVVEALREIPERNRFMKGLYSWVGFKSVGVPYCRPARVAGDTKFNYWRLWNFALDGILSFSTWPLRVWSYIGAIIAVISFLYMLIIIAQALFWNRDVPGYPSLMSTVLFFGGMQLMSIGIIGEYMGRMFVEGKQRPVYIIAESSDNE
ncbi:MAG: glycosyltransferase family 2 protein [Neptuniibacter sp.]